MKLLRSIMGVLFAAILAAGALAGAVYRVESVPTASAAAEILPPVEHIQLDINISGVIRDVLVEADDGLGTERLFVSTDKGLYIFQDKELKRYIPTSSPVTNIATVADFTGEMAGSDARREVVITLDDDTMPNVCCYDTANGDLLWSHSHEQQVYSDTIGWTYLHSVPASLLVLDDRHIACAVSGNLLILDGHTGSRVGGTTLDHPDIMLSYMGLAADINGDGIGDIVGADLDSQHTEGLYHKLYMFSGASGAPLGVINKIPREEQGVAVIMGAVQVLGTQGGRTVAVQALRMSGISIDDVVYVIDLTTRDITAEIDVAGRVTVSAGDITLDGHDDLLNDDGEDLLLYDGLSGEVLWTVEDLNLLEDVAVVSYNDEPAAFGFTEDADGSIMVNYIDLADGATITQIDTGLGATVGNIHQYDANSVVGYSEEELLFITDTGTVDWDVPVVNSSGIIVGDVTGSLQDPVDDTVMLSKYRDARGNESTRVISAIDGASDEWVWSYSIPYALYAQHGGFTWVRITGDLDGDDRNDIAGCMQGDDTSTIIEISGKDGTLIDQIDLAYKVYSFDFVPYETEFSYAVTTLTRAAVIDRVGDYLWSKTFVLWGSIVTEDTPASIKVVDDINADDIPDLATVIKDKVVISASQAPWPDYADEHQIEAESGHQFELADIAFDYDLDAIDDIVVRDIDAPDVNTVIISPASGQKLLTLSYEAYMRPSCADFNDDGTDDHIVIKASLTWPTEQSPLRNLLQMDLAVLSGADGSEMYTRRLYSLIPSVVVEVRTDSFLMPAAPIEDVTGDGIDDLAIFVTERVQKQVNSYVAICDLTQAEGERQIQTFTAFSPTTVQDINWCERIEEIGDVNGNGIDDLALMNGTKMLAVDRELGHTVTQFNVGRELQFVSEGDGVEVLVSCEGSPYYVDMSTELEITSPAAGSSVGIPARLLWDNGFADSFNAISADGAVVGRTNDDHYYLSLAGGEHLVGIGSADRFGKSVYIQTTYTMGNSVGPVVFAFIAAAAVAGVMVALLKLRRMPKFNIKRKGE